MKKKEKIIYVVGIIVLIVTIIIGTSYSLWSITKTQETENVIVVGEYVNSCISVTFEEAIEELATYPKTDEEGKKTSPLRFTIKNECGYITEYEIHLEVLSTTTMSKEVVKAVLDNNEPKKVNEYTSTESVIKNATAHVLEKNILGIEEERTYNFRKWIDEEATQAEVTNKIFDTKISIVSNEYISETNYAYTGSVQEFTVPYTGYYNIELWGAQGAGNTSGQGGYTSGTIYLQKDETLYLYIGSEGKNLTSIAFNGGGIPGYDYCDTGGSPTYRCAHGYWSTGGAGATDVRLIKASSTDNTIWNESTSLRSRVMVAAGGGGGWYGGGKGGGLFGNNGESGRYSASYAYPYSTGRGGTPTGVVVLSGTAYTSKTIYNGSSYVTLSYNVGTVNANYATGGSGGTQFGFQAGGGGGGGYYAGGGGWGEYAAYSGGGGGSSYISGYAGVNSVQETGGTATKPLHTNNTIHYSNKYFLNGKMESGINTGNGKAKITYVGQPQRTNTKLDNVRYIKSCKNGNSVNTDSHWNEIQAIKNGVNVAYGKTITGTVAQYVNAPYTAIVDGGITAGGYGGAGTVGLQCVTIDLGEVYNLDELVLWAYYTDSRIYYQNTLSVGETNISGTISLSTILHTYSGTDGYVETSQGRRYTAWD